MKAPKLSIITINFNNAAGLRKTIESVVNQTSTDIEYIVIDGASTDGSVEVIKEYDKKIRSWISEPDTGIYNAMNKGIRVAKGEYCQFLNSGDSLTTNEITEKMLHKLPDCNILVGNMLKLFPNGKILKDRGVDSKDISLITFYKGTLNHSPAYIKRSLFNKYGVYDESLKIVSDWKWYLISIGLNCEKVEYRNIDVTLFDMTGISNSNSVLIKQERRKVLEELLPINILSDYDTYWRNIFQSKRINRYRLSRYLFWVIERALFKYEKIKRKLYNES